MIAGMVRWVGELDLWQQILLGLFILTSWETVGFFPLTRVRCPVCRRRVWRWLKVCPRCAR